MERTVRPHAEARVEVLVPVVPEVVLDVPEAAAAAVLDVADSALGVLVHATALVAGAEAHAHPHAVLDVRELVLLIAHKVVEQDVARVHRPVDLVVKAALPVADQGVRLDVFLDAKAAAVLDANIIALLNVARHVTWNAEQAV